MREFDYSFLNNGLLPANLLNLTTEIYSLKTTAASQKTESARALKKLEEEAKIQSVKYANAMEGIITSDRRIQEIVMKSSGCQNHNEAEIGRYRDALNEIHSRYAHMDFGQAEILKLHEMIFSFDGDKFGGHYKSDDGVMIGFQPDSNANIRFRLIPVSEAEETMERLELAYQKAIKEDFINPLLLIPCVVLDFLCIHPFEYGNIRMSRLLSTLLLYKNGFDAGRYVSFEKQLNQDKARYDEALRRSVIGWEKNENDYFPFIQNFLASLHMCYKELGKGFADAGGKRLTKKQRIEKTVLESLKPLSKAEICALLPDISPTTVEAALGNMVRDGSVKILGAARNTKYIKSEKDAGNL